MANNPEDILRRIPPREDVQAPKVGQVIQYDYQFPGREKPEYDRPALIAAIDERYSPPHVYIAPVSTVEPRNHTTSREIQEKAAGRLGLPAPRSWIRTHNHNVEKNWPNNVRYVPDDSPHAGQTLYGYVKDSVVEIIGKDFGRNIAQGRMQGVSRSKDIRAEEAKTALDEDRAYYEEYRREMQQEKYPGNDHDDDQGL